MFTSAYLKWAKDKVLADPKFNRILKVEKLPPKKPAEPQPGSTGGEEPMSTEDGDLVITGEDPPDPAKAAKVVPPAPTPAPRVLSKTISHSKEYKFPAAWNREKDEESRRYGVDITRGQVTALKEFLRLDCGNRWRPFPVSRIALIAV